MILYTFLKNTDLHAISAFDVLSHLMGYSSLISLKRYQKWDLGRADKMEVEPILSTTYLLLNLNKEFYTTTPPSIANDGSKKTFRLEAISPHVDAQAILKKIQNRFSNTVETLSHTVIWDLTVCSELAIADLQEDIMKKLVLTVSFRQGLLINPLLETATLTYIPS